MPRWPSIHFLRPRGRPVTDGPAFGWGKQESPHTSLPNKPSTVHTGLASRLHPISPPSCQLGSEMFLLEDLRIRGSQASQNHAYTKTQYLFKMQSPRESRPHPGPHSWTKQDKEAWVPRQPSSDGTQDEKMPLSTGANHHTDLSQSARTHPQPPSILPEPANWVPAREEGRPFPLATGSGNICGDREESGEQRR